MGRLLEGLERRMLETRYQGNNPAAPQGEAGVAVPMGADPAQGRGRFIDDFLNQQAKLIGVEFKPEMNPTASHVIDVLDVSLSAGIDVPVVVGNQQNEFSHYVLVTGRRVNDAGFAEYRFYDPATGSSHWVSAADLIAGQIGVSGYKMITGIEVPSAVGSDPASGSDIGAAADTERDPAIAGSDSDTAPGARFDPAAEVERAKSQTRDERVQILGTDPKKGFIQVEGEVGAMIEAAHGYFRRDPDGGLEWFSLSGPHAGKSFDHLGLPPGTDRFHKDDMAKFTPQVTEHFLKADFVVLDVRFMRPAQVQSVMDYIDLNHPNDKQRLIVIR